MSNVLPQRKGLPHGQPHVWNAISFITVCTSHRVINTLALPSIAPALWEAWLGYAARGICAPLLFVVMPDHTFTGSSDFLSSLACLRPLVHGNV